MHRRSYWGSRIARDDSLESCPSPNPRKLHDAPDNPWRHEDLSHLRKLLYRVEEPESGRVGKSLPLQELLVQVVHDDVVERTLLDTREPLLEEKLLSEAEGALLEPFGQLRRGRKIGLARQLGTLDLIGRLVLDKACLVEAYRLHSLYGYLRYLDSLIQVGSHREDVRPVLPGLLLIADLTEQLAEVDLALLLCLGLGDLDQLVRIDELPLPMVVGGLADPRRGQMSRCP